MQQGCAVVGLELRVIERHPVAEASQLAADHDRIADLQASLDEPAPEPGGVQAPALVLETRDRALHPATERSLHAQLADPRAYRDHLAIGDRAELADTPHLAQVLVASRDLEQQVANQVHADPPSGSGQGDGSRKPRAADRDLEEFERI